MTHQLAVSPLNLLQNQTSPRSAYTKFWLVVPGIEGHPQGSAPTGLSIFNRFNELGLALHRSQLYHQRCITNV